ncbi:hypothetical protein [Sphingomonas edaphi]|uniref:Uncharacterized protein n=1 Tax=Sphingomonas edaphi TaxID=2315689 RepID=A0A418Q2I6_9SPHN|nr:hypothetical protein [Sphingomonas edaphi]RIX32266.1 hypothetical protein D3M59_04705 [Sphingomonas edaphi]
MDENRLLPKRYAEALGYSTLAWALLETGLDILVAITFHRFDGNQSHPEIPRSLSRKIGYLKDIAKLRPGHPWANRILAIAATAGELSDERHHVTHGVATGGFDGESTYVFRLLYEKTMHQPLERPVSVTQLRELSAKTRDAAIAALDLAHEMVDAIKDVDNDPVGKAGR